MTTRILHLTDLHLHTDTAYQLMGVNTRQSLLSVLKHSQSGNSAPDLILITGDLAQDESAQAYLQLIAIFETLEIPVFVLPGNHDNATLMQQLLNTEWISTRQQILLPGWQIVMLDSSIENSNAGRLNDSQLQLLQQYLDEHPHLHTLIGVHHQPVPVGSPWLDTMKIENGDAFMTMILHYPQVKAVLWGHVHQEFSHQIQHIQLLASPASCRQFLPAAVEYTIDPTKGAGYRELLLLEDGTMQTQVQWI